MLPPPNAARAAAEAAAAARPPRVSISIDTSGDVTRDIDWVDGECDGSGDGVSSRRARASARSALSNAVDSKTVESKAPDAEADMSADMSAALSLATLSPPIASSPPPPPLALALAPAGTPASSRTCVSVGSIDVVTTTLPTSRPPGSVSGTANARISVPRVASACRLTRASQTASPTAPAACFAWVASSSWMARTMSESLAVEDSSALRTAARTPDSSVRRTVHRALLRPFRVLANGSPRSRWSPPHTVATTHRAAAPDDPDSGPLLSPLAARSPFTSSRRVAAGSPAEADIRGRHSGCTNSRK